MAYNEFHPDLIEPILATTFSLLMERGETEAASVVANSVPTVRRSDIDYIDAKGWLVVLGLPAPVLQRLSHSEALENEIDSALIMVFEHFPSDALRSRISVCLEPDNADWRLLARQRLSGDGITNQGRANSSNIAARVWDGLLFRSKPETLFYDALKAFNDECRKQGRTGIPFMPLPTVVAGRTLPNKRKRLEPDFVLFKDGLVMVVEIDGDFTHRESPREAHERLEPLSDEGVVYERIKTPSTPQEAMAAVRLIVSKIEKRVRR